MARLLVFSRIYAGIKMLTLMGEAELQCQPRTSLPVLLSWMTITPTARQVRDRARPGDVYSVKRQADATFHNIEMSWSFRRYAFEGKIRTIVSPRQICSTGVIWAFDKVTTFRPGLLATANKNIMRARQRCGKRYS